MRIARSIVGLVVLVSCLTLAPRATAAPTPLASCGTTVTTNVKLLIDLTCTGVPGIVVGKSGITIDLNGHTLTGNRTASNNGIENVGGFDDVTVKDGAVEKFSRGIQGIGAERMRIDHVVSSGNTGTGIIISGESVSITSSTVWSNSDSSDGVYILGNFAHVSSSQVSGNGANGIEITGDSASVTSTVADGNEMDGIHIVGSDARVRSSRASTNDDDGVDVSGDDAKIGQLRRKPSSDRNHADANGFPDGASDRFGQGYFVHDFSVSTAPVGRNEASSNDDPAQCSPTTLC